MAGQLRPGERPDEARVLDIYDYRFFRWTGLDHLQALARVKVSHLSLTRWLADPEHYLGGLDIPAPAWEPGPDDQEENRYPVDTCQVGA